VVRTTGRRGRGALLVVVASLALAACSTSGTVKPVSVAPPSVVPKGAAIVHPTPPSTTDTSCNATASLQPPAVMPTPGQMPTGSFMAQIQARGYLNVGVDQNTYLWGYRDPATGQLTGFDIAILDQVAEAIFGPSYADHIHYTIVPNADRVQAVQKGQVDIVAETMTINCAREKDVDFSTVYYQAGQEILVPDNSTITGPQDLGGKRVCAANGSTSLQNLVAPGMPKHIQLWGVSNETDCLVMLQQGQVDAISTDDAILLGLAAQDPNVKVLTPTFSVTGGQVVEGESSEPYGMAISKAHPEFTSFVNGVLAEVRADGTWAQIYDTYLMPYTKTPAPPPPVASYR
jgi:polar amino acid transport system substrate-binding protein